MKNKLYTLDNMIKVHEEIEKITKDYVNQDPIIVIEIHETPPMHGNDSEIVLKTNKGYFWFGYPTNFEGYDGTKLYVGLATGF